MPSVGHSRNTTRRIAGALGLFLALVAIPAAADPQDRLEEIERRQNAIEIKTESLVSQQNRLTDRISELDDQRTSIESAISELNGTIDRLDERILEQRRELDSVQHHLAILTERYLGQLRRLETATDFFVGRARATYMAGPTAWADTFLSAESFSDLMNRYSYYEASLKSDAELIESIEVLRSETQELREAADEEAQRIIAIKTELETERDKIAELRSAKEEVLAAREQVLALKNDSLSEVLGKKRKLAAIRAELEREEARFEAIIAARTSQATGPLPTGGGQLLWPAAGPVTSGYGWRTHPIFGDQRLHTGIDIAAPYGAPVIASDGGVVVFVGAMSGYGNVVAIDHGNGLSTTYNHLSEFYVGSGQTVGRGEEIAAVGCTGYCTGTHLHFEVRVNGSPVDPMPYLQ